MTQTHHDDNLLSTPSATERKGNKGFIWLILNHFLSVSLHLVGRIAGAITPQRGPRCPTQTYIYLTEMTDKQITSHFCLAALLDSYTNKYETAVLWQLTSHHYSQSITSVTFNDGKKIQIMLQSILYTRRVLYYYHTGSRSSGQVSHED